MIDLNGYQKRLYIWQRDNFGTMPPALLALGVAEESGELCHAILKNAQNIRGMDSEKLLASVKDAVGDLFVYAIQVLTAYGIPVEEAITEVFDYVLTRNWRANRETGEVNAPETVEDNAQDNSGTDLPDEEEESGKSVFEH